MSDGGTSSALAFIETVQQLLRRLEQREDGSATAMTQELDVLLRTFRQWQVTRPSSEVRLTAIQELFALQRRVMSSFSSR